MSGVFKQSKQATLKRREKMWNLVKKFMSREEGQSLVEYALIIALVAVVLVAGITALGTGIGATLTSITGSL
jgi:pilus assembly protein Flp/PilA